jgi:hypothetical protein
MLCEAARGVVADSLLTAGFLSKEVVPRFVDLEVAVPHLSPAVW